MFELFRVGMLMFCLEVLSQVQEPVPNPVPVGAPSDASAEAAIEAVATATPDAPPMVPVPNPALRQWEAAPPLAVPAVRSPFAPAEIDFARDIQPILKRRCYACHDTDDPGKEKNRFDSSEGLTSSGYITPSAPYESEFFQVLSPDSTGEARMPKGEVALSPTEIQLIGRWIQEGAVMPTGDHRLLGRHAVRGVFLIEDDSQLVTIRNDGMFDLWSIATGQRLRRWRVPWMFETTEIINADLRDLKEPQNKDPLSRYLLGIAGHLPNQAEPRPSFPFFLLSGECYSGAVTHPVTLKSGTENSQLQISANGKWCVISSDRFVEAIYPTERIDHHQLLHLSKELLNRTVISSTLSPDDRYIVGFSYDGQFVINIWPVQLQTGRQPKVGELVVSVPFDQEPLDVAWSPDGQVVAAVFADGSIAIFDVVRDDNLMAIVGLEHSGTLDPEWEDSMVPDMAHRCRLRFSPDGKRLLCMGKECVIFELEDERILCRFAGDTAPLCSCLSSDGKTAVTAGFDGSVRIWNAESGGLIRHIRTADAPASDLAWSKDGAMLQWRVGEATVAVDLRNLASASIHPDDVYKPSSIQSLVVERNTLKHNWLDRTVYSQPLKDIAESVRTYAFSSKGLLAASSNRDSTINLYKIHHYNFEIAPIRKFNGHVQDVTDIAFSPNGSLCASSSTDGSIHLWNSRSLYASDQKNGVPWLSMTASNETELYSVVWEGTNSYERPESLIEFRRILPSDIDFKSHQQKVSSILADTFDHVGYTESAIAHDLSSFSPDEAKHQRYFSFAHLIFNGYGQLQNNVCRNSLTFCLNSLSWSKSIIQPVPVDAAASVYRVDLRTLNPDTSTNSAWAVWTREKWDDLTESSPCRQPALNKSDPVRTLTGSDRPWIRGDWFVKEAFEPDRYIELLAIPDEKELIKRVPVADDPIRAGFNVSGIMKHNRLLERRSIQGDGSLYPKGERRYFWKSFDFAGSLDRRNLFVHPTGPALDLDGSAEHFQHDAAEVLFSLPNGMIAFAVFDSLGRRWNRPAADVTRPESEHYPVSCFRCHASGVLSATDQLRTFVQSNPGRFSLGVAKSVLEKHKPQLELEQTFTDDMQVFANARNTSGFFVNAKNLPTQAQTISLVEAVAESVVSQKDLQQKIERYTGPLQALGSHVDRTAFWEAYQSKVINQNAPVVHQESANEISSDTISNRKTESRQPFIFSYTLRMTIALGMLVVSLLLAWLSTKTVNSRLLVSCGSLVCGGISVAVALATLGNPANLKRKPAASVVAKVPVSRDTLAGDQVGSATDDKVETLESPSLAWLRNLSGTFIESTEFDSWLDAEAVSAADHLVNAWVYNERQEPDTALAAASKALELDPNLTAAIAERGYALLLTQNFAAAQSAVEEYHAKIDGGANSQAILPLHGKVNWFVSTARDRFFEDDKQIKEFLQTVPELSKLLVIAELAPHDRQLSRCVYTVAMADDWSETLDFKSASFFARLAERLAQATDEPRVSSEMLADALRKSGLHMRKQSTRDDPVLADVVQVLEKYIQTETQNIPHSLNPSARFVKLSNVLSRLLEDAINLQDELAIERAAERYKGIGTLVAECRTQDAILRERIFESLQTSHRRLQSIGKSQYAEACLELAQPFQK